jgi:hypothetical protein
VCISLKVINSELERRGAQAVLTRGDGYFYFRGGDATDWLDRTVRVPTLHSITLEQWIEQFHILREKNSAFAEWRDERAGFQEAVGDEAGAEAR